MNTIVSVAGIGLVLGLFTMLIPIALLVMLQVWLCRRGKWLGVILPGLSLLLSLLLIFGITAFQGESGSAMTDETGQVLQEHHGQEDHHMELTPGAVGAVAGLFLVSNIPTVVFGGIWLYYKNRRDFQEDLKKMKIEDLE